MTGISNFTLSARDGIKLRGDQGGATGAPSVILLHGGGQTRHSWSGAMRMLQKAGYRVLSYDARGHGDSEWSKNGAYSLDDLADDLDTVIEMVEGPVVLVGASMGGMTAFYAAGRGTRHQVVGIVLVDVVLRPAERGSDRIRQFMTAHDDGFASLEAAVDAVADYNPNRPRSSNPQGLMRNLRMRDDGRLYWHWDPRLMKSDGDGVEPPANADRLEAISGAVTIPTLVVRGQSSDVIDDESLAQMKTLVPQTEVALVPGAGHMVVGDHNDAFNAAVINFLSRVLPLRARA